jgi:hypothetical protein
MSIFKVQLQNTQQGRLDRDPSTATPVAIGGEGARYLGTPFNPSIQRTIYVPGPHGIFRKLVDGTTFTDNNYWKRYAFPQVPLDQAFIFVVTDDRSVYSDVDTENVFPVTYGGATAYTVAAVDTFSTNSIDVAGTYGGFAVFAQFKNFGTIANQDITVQLNNSATAVFHLIHGTTQIFDAGDLMISKLAFDGGVADTTIEIIMSIRLPNVT